LRFGEPSLSAQLQRDSGYLVLRHEDTRLTLDPVHGGGIREFSWRGQQILRPTPGGAGADPFDLACFPMVPFANRIGHGRFSFGRQSVQLQRNWDAEPHPLHGQGWRAQWVVADASASQATLSFEGGADDWPWRYRSEQHLLLSQSALTVRLSIENLAATPMPAVLGLHPYFLDAATARLQAQLPRVWLTDEGSLPIKEVPTPAQWRFDPARSISGVSLDHCFADWDGTAQLRWPDRTVNMRAINCRCLHLYTPRGRDFFCLEPQTAPAGALGRDRGEATVVQPGERFAMQVSFEIGAS
jgi:aldose 1-epimerase